VVNKDGDKNGQGRKGKERKDNGRKLFKVILLNCGTAGLLLAVLLSARAALCHIIADIIPFAVRVVDVVFSLIESSICASGSSHE